MADNNWGRSGMEDKAEGFKTGAEARIKDLQAKAKNATGDAKMRIQEQINELQNSKDKR
jgi:uncharacterized protein involved in exopolysaccharide biosynthesis